MVVLFLLLDVKWDVLNYSRYHELQVGWLKLRLLVDSNFGEARLEKLNHHGHEVYDEDS